MEASLSKYFYPLLTSLCSSQASSDTIGFSSTNLTEVMEEGVTKFSKKNLKKGNFNMRIVGDIKKNFVMFVGVICL